MSGTCAVVPSGLKGGSSPASVRSDRGVELEIDSEDAFDSTKSEKNPPRPSPQLGSMLPRGIQVRVRVVESVESPVPRWVEDVGDVLVAVLVLENDVGACRRDFIPEEPDVDAAYSPVGQEFHRGTSLVGVSCRRKLIGSNKRSVNSS